MRSLFAQTDADVLNLLSRGEGECNKEVSKK